MSVLSVQTFCHRCLQWRHTGSRGKPAGQQCRHCVVWSTVMRQGIASEAYIEDRWVLLVLNLNLTFNFYFCWFHAVLSKKGSVQQFLTLDTTLLLYYKLIKCICSVLYILSTKALRYLISRCFILKHTHNVKKKTAICLCTAERKHAL